MVNPARFVVAKALLLDVGRHRLVVLAQGDERDAWVVICPALKEGARLVLEGLVVVGARGVDEDVCV